MSEVIEYNQLVGFLKEASLFEIYRVSAAIKNELDNPMRINAVRQQFQVGDAIEYFDERQQSFVSATVLDKHNKNVSLRNQCDGRCWKVPYYLLRLNSRDFDFNSQSTGLSKNELKVGDRVGFNKDGQEIIGTIERLNQKTVSIRTSDNHRWRVAYSYLYFVIEGEGEACGDFKVLIGQDCC